MKNLLKLTDEEKNNIRDKHKKEIEKEKDKKIELKKGLQKPEDKKTTK